MEFKEFKSEILSRAKTADACEDGYNQAENSEDFIQLFNVIKKYFNWCCNNKVIDCALLEKVKEEAKISEIFINESTSVGFLLCDSATVEALDSATVEAWGSATVKAWGSATVKAWGSATVKAWDSAYICSYNSIEAKLSDKAIQRFYYGNRIVVSKDTIINTY